MQNVRGLFRNVQTPGRYAELGINIGRFNLRRSRGRVECEAYPTFVDTPNDPFVK